MTDPTERLEYFATNDTAHGGDCCTLADCEDEAEAKPDSTMQDVFAYLRAVKRFGLALQQLGRRCDE